MTGHIEAIHLAAREGEPTFAVDEAGAVEHFGLEGDRLTTKARAEGREVEPHRQVTFIEAEALEAISDFARYRDVDGDGHDGSSVPAAPADPGSPLPSTDAPALPADPTEPTGPVAVSGRVYRRSPVARARALAIAGAMSSSAGSPIPLHP